MSEKNKKIPKIRFKDKNWNDFPEWKKVSLGELIKDKTLKNKDLKINFVLSVNNKKWFIPQAEQFEWYQVASSDLSTYKIVKKWDFAYNPSRINVGSIAYLKDFDIWIVSPMYVIFTLNNLLNPDFFINLLKTHKLKHSIKIWCSWSVRDSLNFNDLSDIKISLPTIEEQQKIADFLSEINEKINLKEKEIYSTKDYKKGLLQKMFA